MEHYATQLLDMAKEARIASHSLQAATITQRNNVLINLAEQLQSNKEAIGKANEIDVKAATIAVDHGTLSSATFKRLDVLGPNGSKLDALVQGVHDVIKLNDPINQITLARELDTGLDLYRVTCPIGVLLIIFEARPEVVIQISCLAIKSGNAVILKGGKEATHTLQQLHNMVQKAIVSQNLPKQSVQIIQDRMALVELLKFDKYIDIVIPRGSGQLVRYIKDSTRIPVLGHADGICSIYLDKDLPIEFAAKVVVDAKTQYPAACNAAETLLIHSDLVPTQGLAIVLDALLQAGVTLKCDDRIYPVAKTIAHQFNIPSTQIEKATITDWDSEYLDLIMAVRVIDSLDEAMNHIAEHGSGHTDVILTSNMKTANTYMRGVDSAGVYWNASSRFADGYRYSFGCEVGVSTNRIHARGPVGLEGLVCYKYRMHGHGQVVAEYGGQEGGRQYSHRRIEVSQQVEKMVQGE